MSAKILGFLIVENGEIKMVNATEAEITALISDRTEIQQERVEVAMRLLSEVESEKIIAETLNRMGIPAHIKGYRFLQSAITKVLSDREYIDNITKMLYPGIAKDFNTTPTRVERAIRHAIEISWSKGAADYMEEEFKAFGDFDSGKMPNSRFIATVVEGLKLKYNMAT